MKQPVPSALRIPLTASFLVLSMAAGCASAGGEASERTTSRGDSRLITREELVGVSVSNAYEAIERLRPLWLSRGSVMSVNQATEIVVLQDENFFGGIGSLRQIPVEPIREMRYMTGSEATNRYPSLATGRIVAGAILVFLGPSR